MPRCSVIIPVYNRAALTAQCLEQLFACPPAARDCEVIVVDDASHDATPRLLAGYEGRIRVVRHEQNRGFATSCNDGAAAAAGEHLVFLNNDTVPLPGWLDALVAHAGAHPRAGAVGSKLLYPDGTIQHAGMVICQDREPRHLYRGFPADHPAVNKSRRFQLVTGGCVLIAREAFTRASGFDTAFLNGHEDVDLMLRLGEMGYEVHYCHQSELYHLESVSEGRNRNAEHNDRLYRTRWHHRVVPDDWRYYLEDGLIQVRYGWPYHLELTVSPLLGAVGGDAGRGEADRLLGLRARQVHDLLRENILMRIDRDAPGGPLPGAA